MSQMGYLAPTMGNGGHERSRVVGTAGRVEDQFYENPLAIGLAVVAAGLAAGFALPTTRKESELMGGTRDRLVDRAREAARETKEKVQHVAERVVDQTTTTAREAARQKGLTR